jgi:methylmalonyl-CoA/ethylmalonyl-CoA epimerase
VDDVRAAVEELRKDTEVTTEPPQIFTHEDDRLGPAGTTEWQAFVTDSEGNSIGLASFASDSGR